MRNLRNFFFEFFSLSLVEFLNVKDFFILAFLKRIQYRPECFSLLIEAVRSMGEFRRLYMQVQVQGIGVFMLTNEVLHVIHSLCYSSPNKLFENL